MKRITLDEVEGGLFVNKTVFMIHDDGRIVQTTAADSGYASPGVVVEAVEEFVRPEQ